MYKLFNMNKDERGVEKYFNDEMDCEKNLKFEIEICVFKISE